MSVKVTADLSAVAGLKSGPLRAMVKSVVRKAGSTALRDMRAEASKRIRTRKRIKPSYIKRAIALLRPKGSTPEWSVKVSGEPVPLVAYPHRQTKRGVSVEVNRGKRTIVRGSFVATMRSGHKGVFKRSGKARLPIKELLGSRPLDALLHKGEAEAVAERGGKSFIDTFERLFMLELDKKSAPGIEVGGLFPGGEEE
jgi:hypothetical protein